MPKNTAIIALVHRILIILYHVITTGQPYQERGPAYHDARDRTQIVQRTVRRLEHLGYRVTVVNRRPSGDNRPPAFGVCWGMYVVVSRVR